MPNVRLELATLRSRVECSTNWASQVPQHYYSLGKKSLCGGQLSQIACLAASLAPIYQMLSFSQLWQAKMSLDIAKLPQIRTDLDNIHLDSESNSATGQYEKKVCELQQEHLVGIHNILQGPFYLF